MKKIKIPSHISVKLSNDVEITKLNDKYFDRNYPTDVLTFTMNEPLESEGFYLGDIIVNVDQAKRQCEEYDNSVYEELAELVGHGVLHLLGIHHDGDDDTHRHGEKVI